MKNDKLIALYFEDKLNADQKLDFERRLKSDADFKAQFELEQHVKTAIISSKKDALRERLQQLEQPKKTNKFYRIAIAASIIVAMGIFGILQYNTTPNNSELFAEYFKPYTNVIAPSVRGDKTKDAKNEAFRYYDIKNYKVASKKFELLYNDTKTSYYLFYQAICELELNNTNKAIELLKAHKSYSDKVSQHRNWYLALAYLKAGKAEKAKILLKNIISQKAYKFEASKELLKKID